MPSGSGNPFAHSEHGPNPSSLTQQELDQANTNPNYNGNAASGTPAVSTPYAPGTIPLPKPILYDGWKGTVCSNSGTYGDPAAWYAANRITWLSYPVASYGCICTEGNSAGGCQAHTGKFLKVVDAIFLSLGLVLALIGALSGSIALAGIGTAVALFGILNAQYGWLNP